MLPYIAAPWILWVRWENGGVLFMAQLLYHQAAWRLPGIAGMGQAESSRLPETRPCRRRGFRRSGQRKTGENGET